MGFLSYLSDYIIPFTIFYIVGFGILMKVDVFDEFIKGAKEGLKIVVSILPTLVGLMVAVGILRVSGTLDILSNIIKPITNIIKFPSELVPLVIVKTVSSSAATGLVLDIFKEFGTDSYIGKITSIMMSCTETIFYTMSVYFMTAGVRKTRYTLLGAIISTLAGIIASVILAGMI